MNRTLAISVTGLSLAALCISADAQQLPKSGAFSINSWGHLKQHELANLCFKTFAELSSFLATGCARCSDARA